MRAELLVAGLALMALAAPVRAEAPPTPANLAADYDEATQTWTLTWDDVAGYTPEPGGSDYYILYRNGEQVWTGTDNEHSFQLSGAASADAFQVAVLLDGEESARSEPVTVGWVRNPITTCDVYTITINPNGPPYWGYQLRPECLIP